MNFSISLNSVLSAINSRSLLSFLSSTIYPTYGIYYAKDNKSALDFNSVIRFNHSGDSVISSAPVGAVDNVAGSYSSINKVTQPSKISMRIAVEGMTAFSGLIPRVPSTNNLSLMTASRTDVINRLEEMKNSADIYNIETPDRVYANYDLINYDFVMSANSGITLLAVDLNFQEVRTLQIISEAIQSAKKTTATNATLPQGKEVY